MIFRVARKSVENLGLPAALDGKNIDSRKT
jgi:hypothetical protein